MTLPFCSPEYVALLRRTQALGVDELQELSGQYDAVYFHPVRAPETKTPTQALTRVSLPAHGRGCQPWPMSPCLWTCPAHLPAAPAGTWDYPGPVHSALAALQPGTGLGRVCPG